MIDTLFINTACVIDIDSNINKCFVGANANYSEKMLEVCNLEIVYHK